jgi:hypothetical protein
MNVKYYGLNAVLFFVVHVGGGLFFEIASFGGALKLNSQ